MANTRTAAPPPKFDDFLSMLQDTSPEASSRVTANSDFDPDIHNSLKALVDEGFITHDECVELLQSIFAGTEAHGSAYGKKMIFNGDDEDPGEGDPDDGDDEGLMAPGNEPRRSAIA